MTSFGKGDDVIEGGGGEWRLGERMTSQEEGEMDDATGGGEENDATGGEEENDATGDGEENDVTESDITMRGDDVTEARKKMTS